MQLLKLLLILALIGAGTYIAVFKRGDARRKAGGYSRAETPKAAADFFVKALQDRDFDIAADYCTEPYASQMRVCQAEANEYAIKLDNLVYQMNERGLIRDELKNVFLWLDPFPKNVTVVVSAESGDKCEALLKFGVPFPRADQPTAGAWQLRREMFNVYLSSIPFVNDTTAKAVLKKDGDAWKFDFGVNDVLRKKVVHLKEKSKNYVNPFSMITQEVKTDPTTKENVTKRLKELLEQAAKE